MTAGYVHGYDDREQERLRDQAGALVELLHHDSDYPAGSTVLEAGCGVGAQTVTLAARNPDVRFTSIDVSPASLELAAQRIAGAGLGNVELRQADLFALPFEPASFDHLFLCFVLEHLPDPPAALGALLRVVRPGGSVTVIEGDHGSASFHPDSSAARAAIGHLVDLQRAAGGDALIGRRLHPLLVEAGLADVRVEPRMVYVDGNRPDLADAFTLRTFTAMVEGVRQRAIDAALTDAASFDAGIRDLRRTAEPDGTFCYTFFKAVARRPS